MSGLPRHGSRGRGGRRLGPGGACPKETARGRKELALRDKTTEDRRARQGRRGVNPKTEDAKRIATEVAKKAWKKLLET